MTAAVRLPTMKRRCCAVCDLGLCAPPIVPEGWPKRSNGRLPICHDKFRILSLPWVCNDERDRQHGAMNPPTAPMTRPLSAQVDHGVIESESGKSLARKVAQPVPAVGSAGILPAVRYTHRRRRGRRASLPCGQRAGRPLAPQPGRAVPLSLPRLRWIPDRLLITPSWPRRFFNSVTCGHPLP